MASRTPVSEPAFLLIELRYTLDQLRVQLDSATVEPAPVTEERVDGILADMLDYEAAYRSRYADKLDAPLSEQRSDGLQDRHAAFAMLRLHTIELLQAVPEPWPDELLNLVREHVMDDRKHVTHIAEQRPEVAERDQRDDPALPGER